MTVAKLPVEKEEKAPTPEKEMITFTFNDKEYSVDKNKISEDLDVLEAFEDGKIITPMKMLLGLKQWNAFKEAEKPNAEILGKFAEALFDVLGGEPGE